MANLKRFEIDGIKELFFNYEGHYHLVYQYKGVNFERERDGDFVLQVLSCDGNLNRKKTMKLWSIKFHRLTSSEAAGHAKYLGNSIEKAKIVIDKLLMEIETEKYNL